MLTTRGQNISELSEYGMYDLSTVSTALLQKGLGRYFEDTLTEYYKSLMSEKSSIVTRTLAQVLREASKKFKTEITKERENRQENNKNKVIKRKRKD